MKSKFGFERVRTHALSGAIIMSIAITPFLSEAQQTPPEQTQAQHFTCSPSKSDEEMPSQIQIDFSPEAQMQSVQVLFEKPFKNSISSAIFNLQNSVMSTVTGGDDPTFNPDKETVMYLSQDWGDGISAAIGFKTTDFRGQKYSPYESLVGEWIYQNINGPYMDGKLSFFIYNSKFPARWGARYHCQQVL